jgi:hypothetical protein
VETGQFLFVEEARAHPEDFFISKLRISIKTSKKPIKIKNKTNKINFGY